LTTRQQRALLDDLAALNAGLPLPDRRKRGRALRMVAWCATLLAIALWWMR
jgi:hypothetical protein